MPDNDWLHACTKPLVMKGNGPYGFGVDPAWRTAKTELTYLNRCAALCALCCARVLRQSRKPLLAVVPFGRLR